MIGAVNERFTDLAEGTFIEIQADRGQLVACINRIVATRVPNRLEYRLIRAPFVNIVTGLPKHIGTVELLNDQNIQQHRCGRLVRICVVVAHERVVRIVQYRRDHVGIGRACLEGMLETKSMTNFMNEGHVVIGAFDRIRIIRRGSDPDIAGQWLSIRKIGPGSGFRIHAGVTAKAQISCRVKIVTDQCELDIGYGTPCAEGTGDSNLLGRGQGETVQEFVIRTVVFCEVRLPGCDEAVCQPG